MKKLLSYKFLIFSFLFMKDVLCTKNDLRTRSNDEKIVGGNEIDIKYVPYQAGLTIETDHGDYGCGGSIISKKYILTAAHCIISGTKIIYVRVGSNYKYKEGQLYTSTKFLRHPNYNNRTIDNDAGILILDKPIVFNSKVKPIRLAKKGRNIPGGTKALITGWGRTTENGQVSDTLRAIIVPIISNQDCLGNYTYISENMICAGLPEGGKSVCQGDSGGPAQSKYGQIGIASFSIGCARPGYPGGYARVSSPSIRGWITRVTGI